jgi:hypothetical protein
MRKGSLGDVVQIGFERIEAARQSGCRDYIKPQTALYTNWLVFRNEPLATHFLKAFPQYNLEKKIEGLQHERQLLAGRVQQRLKRSRFDLSRYSQKSNVQRLRGDTLKCTTISPTCCGEKSC